MNNETVPAARYCPYCGLHTLKLVKRVPRCTVCRAVFHLTFSRWARKSPSQPGATHEQ